MLEVRDQRIGKKVKLSALGKEAFGDISVNPHDVTGMFMFNDGTDILPLVVVWSNMTYSFYDAEHLELA